MPKMPRQFCRMYVSDHPCLFVHTFGTCRFLKLLAYCTNDTSLYNTVQDVEIDMHIISVDKSIFFIEVSPGLLLPHFDCTVRCLMLISAMKNGKPDQYFTWNWSTKAITCYVYSLTVTKHFKILLVAK